MTRRHAFASFPGALLLTLASTALADPPPGDPAASEQRLPLAKTERPLTLPRLILEPDLDGGVTRIGSNGTYGNLNFGASFGVIDSLAVRALVLPLQLAGPPGTGFHYGEESGTKGPSVGATLALVRGRVELGVALDVRALVSQDLSGVSIIPAVPLHVHLARWVRLDVSPGVNVARATAPAGTFAPGGGTTTVSTPANAVRLSVPVDLLFNVIEPLYVELTTGLTIWDFNDVRGTTGIPVGITAGYAIAGKHGPLLDIDPYFNFPYLFMPGESQVTNAGEYVVGLRVYGYIYY